MLTVRVGVFQSLFQPCQSYFLGIRYQHRVQRTPSPDMALFAL
jgi:hypothetical protein